MAYAQIAQQEKVGDLVDFPVEGLDMRQYVQDQSVRDSPDPILYDLYAVSNHYGGLHGGHYTAYAYNSEAKQWFDFNDSSVSRTQASEVVTQGAYLLFYRRREQVPSPSAGVGAGSATREIEDS